MKKLIAMLLCLTLALSLSACGKDNTQTATDAPVATDEAAVTEAPQTATDEPTQTEAASEKTGVAIVTDLSGSTSASADAEGVAKSDSIVVAVTVDANGVITNCAIDSVQASIKFDQTGVITSDLNAEVVSKQALGASYGMAAASGIGKEWNEQVDYLAAFVVGKTAAQVQGIALNADTTPADADLSSGCTIHVAGYLSAIAAAVENAQDLGAKAGDTLGMSLPAEDFSAALRLLWVTGAAAATAAACSAAAAATSSAGTCSMTFSRYSIWQSSGSMPKLRRTSAPWRTPSTGTGRHWGSAGTNGAAATVAPASAAPWAAAAKSAGVSPAAPSTAEASS